MNKTVSAPSLTPSEPLKTGSPELEALLNQIAEGASARERDRVLPFDVIDLIRRARLGALRLPVSAGGAGSTIRDLFAFVIRLGEADANVAHILRNHFSVVERLVRTPKDAQSRDWQKAVAGGAIIGLATTELESPRVGNVTPGTTFTPDGNGDYLLNGTKYYSTGTLYSDYVLVRAADPSGATGATIVPIKREGIELVDDWDGLGQRLTATGTTHFHNVKIRRQEVVFDEPDSGYGVPYSNTFAQLFLTAVVAGIARATLRDATALIHSRKRTFYYAPTEIPTDDPLLQQTVGQIASGAFAAEAVVLAAAEALDVATDAFDAGRRQCGGCGPHRRPALGQGQDHRGRFRHPRRQPAVRRRRRIGDQEGHQFRPPLAQRANPVLAQSNHLQGALDRPIRDQRHTAAGERLLLGRKTPSRPTQGGQDMGRSDIHLVTDSNEIEHQFRAVMRRLAGGVSIITAGRDDDITGMTVTSLTSLSASPPRVLVSVNRQASSFALIERFGTFGVNILGSDQQELADRFSDGRLKGPQRFEGIPWSAGTSGVPLLGNSLATIECQVEEIIERYSHGIIVGSLVSFDLSHELSGLVYWNGQYIEIKHDFDLDLLAEISIPLAHVR